MSSSPRKLQVFVSSTYTDLKEERQAAVEAILLAGHIPAGMELFAEGDKEQMDVIRRWIKESDVFMLILGGRYGSIEPDSGKSYTHLEYDYATELEMPRFTCVIQNDELDRRIKEHGRQVIETDEPKKLTEFRSTVTERKIANFWRDKKEIRLAVLSNLLHFSQDATLRGWVRPTEADVGKLAAEIARLSQENAELRTRINSQGNGQSSLALTVDEHFQLMDRLGVRDVFRDLCDKLFYGVEVVEDLYPKMSRLVEIGLVSNGRLQGEYKLTESGTRMMNIMRLRGIKKEEK